MSGPEVVLSGYVSMDRIIDIDTELRPGFTSLVLNRDNSTLYYGGCSVNIAYGLARLGVDAAPVIRVGDDYEASGLKRFLTEAGVSTAGVSHVPGEMTSNCYLLEDASGQHVTVYYPGSMAAEYATSLPPGIFADAKLGVITVASAADNTEFLARCKAQGVPVAFGMKSDFDAFPPELLREILDYASVIFLNHSEREAIETLYGLESIRELFASPRLQVVIVTSGVEGSHCYERGNDRIQRSLIPAVLRPQVVDATGSGDAYMAGFIHGYLKQAKPTECAQMGSTFASFAVEARGSCTGLPTRQQFWQRYEQVFGKEGKR